VIGPLGVRIRTVLLGASTAALLALPGIPAAEASSGASLACTITSTEDLHPGLTAEVHPFTAGTHGLESPAVCTGTVNGFQVTGPGRWLANGHAVGSCASSSGDVNFVLRVPTTAGERTVTGHFSFSGTISSPVAVLTGDATGTTTIVSTVGNCFTTPLVQDTVVDRVQITT
jgi:hypothetical protein